MARIRDTWLGLGYMARIRDTGLGLGYRLGLGIHG